MINERKYSSNHSYISLNSVLNLTKINENDEELLIAIINESINGFNNEVLFRELFSQTEMLLLEGFVYSLNKNINNKKIRIPVKLREIKYLKDISLKNSHIIDKFMRGSKTFNKDISLDKAIKILFSILENYLSCEDYKELRDAIENGHLQVNQEQEIIETKFSFCYRTESNEGSYILLTYDGTLDDVFTLAHELGHYYFNECINKSSSTYNSLHSELFANLFEKILLNHIAEFISVSRKEIDEYNIELYIENVYTQLFYFYFELGSSLNILKKENQRLDIFSELYSAIFKEFYPLKKLSFVENVNYLFVPHFRSTFTNVNYIYSFLNASYLYDLYKKDIFSTLKESPDIFKEINLRYHKGLEETVLYYNNLILGVLNDG